MSAPVPRLTSSSDVIEVVGDEHVPLVVAAPKVEPGRPGGAVIGGFAVGIIENLAGTYIPVVGREMKLSIALCIIVAVLCVKPSGLFGRPVVTRV